MADNSKWTNTKHRKALQDAKRAKIFTNIIRELVTAARLGDGDVSPKPGLSAVADKTLANNITRSTLNRAIVRGVGSDDAQMEAIIYESYDLGGTAVMVEYLSDNRNRTVSELRYAFTKTGSNLGTDDSVSYLLIKRGTISFALSQDTIMDAVLEADADDVITYDNRVIDSYTTPDALSEVKDAFVAAGLTLKSSEIALTPPTRADLNAETAPKLLRFISMLEDANDVQEVYYDGEISDEMLATL
ncbi:hypothetical protein BG74_08290 [Sodalis-like endosymbiont of Proechinophthirus fluctus]|uniref:YebC/PmpR family DNA-binding transcriptional regulator n=1 Tax=Sodalis-like endosymbiont of Proechinophthirus fluctus TaxID=1462730 RepID=UPI0007A7FD31|nr:YebC/PmpR family DNA-binding transcriptional regulator [Sodalis-like endosymbiont of Proechinophthirus fluctus]KYP95652.1 hypothetical protein BG74_08290 [Sodalis-like endosymbiont of Proechinophthirus fluctus]